MKILIRILSFVLLCLPIWSLQAQFIDFIILYRVGNTWGYSNKAGELIIQPGFDFAEKFQIADRPQFDFEGKKDTILFARVKKDKRWFYINSSGDSIHLKLNYGVCGGSFSFPKFGWRQQKGDKLGFRFDNGAVIPAQYLYIRDVAENLVLVQTTAGTYGMLNDKNEWILEPRFAELHMASTHYKGLFWYQENGLWGLIDLIEERMTPSKFKEKWDFVGNIALVRSQAGKLHYINRDFKAYYSASLPAGQK